MPYIKHKRFYGEGECRIGTRLSINDDIYCCGFIAYLRDDIVSKTLNIMTGELRSEEDTPDTDITKLEENASSFNVDTSLNADSPFYTEQV